MVSRDCNLRIRVFTASVLFITSNFTTGRDTKHTFLNREEKISSQWHFLFKLKMLEF